MVFPVVVDASAASVSSRARTADVFLQWNIRTIKKERKKEKEKKTGKKGGKREKKERCHAPLLFASIAFRSDVTATSRLKKYHISKKNLIPCDAIRTAHLFPPFPPPPSPLHVASSVPSQTCLRARKLSSCGHFGSCVVRGGAQRWRHVSANVWAWGCSTNGRCTNIVIHLRLQAGKKWPVLKCVNRGHVLVTW